jgi:hypothetical protein
MIVGLRIGFLMITKESDFIITKWVELILKIEFRLITGNLWDVYR